MRRLVKKQKMWYIKNNKMTCDPFKPSFGVDRKSNASEGFKV